MIADFRIPGDRFPCRETKKLTIQLHWLSWKTLEEVVAVPEGETVSQLMTAPPNLEAVIASLKTATKEKVGLGHVETLSKESPSGQVTEKVAFPSSAPLSVVPSSGTPSNSRLNLEITPRRTPQLDHEVEPKDNTDERQSRPEPNRATVRSLAGAQSSERYCRAYT